MALSRPLFVGFSSASKAAREGGDLEVTVETEEGPVTFTLPWFFVRQVDALLERWRREEHEAVLLTMNDGVLGATLQQAARVGGLRDSTFLLARGADVNYEHEGRSALASAARGDHLAVVTLLLDKGALQLGHGLHHSAVFGHLAVAALLLDRGADIEYGGGEPLRCAASNGHLEFVRLLLDRGANINAVAGYGYGYGITALQRARARGQQAVVALLLERGAVDVGDD